MPSEVTTRPPIFSASDLRRIRAFVSAQLAHIAGDRTDQKHEGSASPSSNDQDTAGDEGEVDDQDQAKGTT